MTMVTACPCCGAVSMFDAPLVDLTNNVVSFRGRAAAVRPKVAEMLHVLSVSHPAPVPRSRLIAQLWGLAEPDCAAGGVRLLAYHARLAVKDWPLDVRGDARRGYRLIVG